MRALHVIFRNVSVIVGIVVALSVVSALVLDIASLRPTPLTDGRANSRAYQNPETAAAVLADFRRSASYRYRPFVGWQRRPLQSQHVNIGSDGYRVHQANPDNVDSARLVGVYGGSTVWGTGVSDGETIAGALDLLSNKFRTRNFGETNYTSRQNLALLINQLNVGSAPDIIVFYDGITDVATHCRGDISPTGHAQEKTMSDQLFRGRNNGESYLGNVLLAPTQELVRRVGRHLGFTSRDAATDAPYRCDTDPDRAKEVAAKMIGNWAAAALLAHARGKTFIAILQPVAILGEPDADYVGLPPPLARQFPPVYAEASAQIRAQFDWAFDFTDAFDGVGPIYIDYSHVNAQGNRLIAERILRILDPQQ
jgi:hypothetical protein